jgi:hypothetical protein
LLNVPSLPAIPLCLLMLLLALTATGGQNAQQFVFLLAVLCR